jgi:membrane-bound inhibitor of C-type lysozyme
MPATGRLGALAGLALATGCATQADTGPHPVLFACADGRNVLATFRDEHVDLKIDGRAVSLPQTVAASGARYEADGTLFWNKGDEAQLEADGAATNCETTGT